MNFLSEAKPPAPVAQAEPCGHGVAQVTGSCHQHPEGWPDLCFGVLEGCWHDATTSPPWPGRSQGRTWLAEHGATGWCLEQSRNQLQSKVQQLEELPEAPELYVVSREPLGGDLSPLWCTRHFLGQEFTGNSEKGHQAWLHTPC